MIADPGPTAPFSAAALDKWCAAPEPTPADFLRYERALRVARRAGGELRGNNRDRARRRALLLLEFGDGRACPCSYCGHRLTGDDLQQDRIYPEGGYRLHNLLPACRRCNLKRCRTPYVHPWEDGPHGG